MSLLRIPFVAISLIVVVGSAAPGAEELEVVWKYATPGAQPQAIVADQRGRDCLYVVMKMGGLAILDISRPQAVPTVLATVRTTELGGMDVMHLTQAKDLLYLALGDFFNRQGSPTGLAVVDVAEPRRPRVLTMWTSPDRLRGAAIVIVRDDFAYLGAMEYGVLILDMSNPRNVRQAARILPDVDFPRKDPGKIQHPNARGLALKDQYLYVAFDSGGLRVIDVADPRRPIEVGRYINAGMKQKQQAYNNLVIDGATAFVAVDYAGLEVLDIRDPRQIRQIAWWNPWRADTLENLWFNSPGHTNQIEYDARRQRVYLSAGDRELLVVDVKDRTHPKLAAQYGAPKDRRGVWGLTLDDDAVYLAYITTLVPFHGAWSGIKAVAR